MAEQRLNQVLAVEHGLKNRTEVELTGIYHTLQKGSLFDGMTRSYAPLHENGDKLPTEHKKVQQSAQTMLKEATAKLSSLFDITATKDFANCSAKADLVVDNETVLKDVPVTFLLFLESQLIHVRTLFTHLPELDPAETWVRDDNDGLFKTTKLEKVRTQKVQRAIVLYDATEKHPAQTQLINEDVNVGKWEEQKISGAFPTAEKKKLLERVERLIAAVKRAREAANLTPAPNQEVGAKVFGWLFK